MIRALLFAFATSVILAIGMRLFVRWRFGGRGKTVNRLAPHGWAEYGAFALFVATAISITTAQRIDDAWEPLTWAVAVLLAALAFVAGFFVFFTHVFWTVEGIGAWDPWHKQRFIRWEHVRRVGWSALHQAWLVSDGTTTIRYGTWRRGVAELNGFVERRMNPVAIRR